MVISSENRKAAICLHQNRVNSKYIAQQRLANVRAVQKIIISWKETGYLPKKKGGERQNVSNDPEAVILYSVSSNRFATSSELSEGWKKIEVKSSP